MKKIKVTILTAAEDFPGCADILGICPEIEVVARQAGLHERGARAAVYGSDVLVLDETVLEREGATALRTLQHTHPLVRLLLVMDESNENKVMDALALGFSGVIERASLRAMLRRAIPALYAGEAWVPRGFARSLRIQLLRRERERYTGLRPDFSVIH